MQSDWNSLCQDVVLDSFNMPYRDEDGILDHTMKYKYFGIFNKKPEHICFIYFGLKCCLHPEMSY